MRNSLLLFFLLYLLPLHCTVLEENLDKIDRFIEASNLYMQRKENAIRHIHETLRSTTDKTRILEVYNELYNAYYTYRFDSAMAYVNKGETLAKKSGNAYYYQVNVIHRSVLLSTSGLYSQSVENLRKLNPHILDKRLLPDYYMAYVWTYSYWADFCDDEVYKPEYVRLHKYYIEQALKVIPPDTALYEYMRGEYFYKKGRNNEAAKHYARSLRGLPVNTRLYAMVTYSLARYYLMTDQEERYLSYMTMAVISDIVNPLKENLAMQDMAMHIFQHYPEEIERANHYINFSMQDARFYHNRLRMIEISNKLPVIVAAYQTRHEKRNRRLRTALAGIGFLTISLLGSLFFIKRQYNQLSRKKAELAESNRHLQALNQKLVTTNNVRESYVNLFLDLCAGYIEKLARYRELVQRKVKARQVDDLLKAVSSTRLTESEALTFFTRFDAAFLELYPDFIRQFNLLLRENARITPRQSKSLTTGLRIFALIRLGVKDSSEIATLLFYSPQTIYNYRSNMKNKALHKETFEKDVIKLCPLI